MNYVQALKVQSHLRTIFETFSMNEIARVLITMVYEIPYKNVFEPYSLVRARAEPMREFEIFPLCTPLQNMSAFPSQTDGALPTKDHMTNKFRAPLLAFSDLSDSKRGGSNTSFLENY